MGTEGFMSTGGFNGRGKTSGRAQGLVSACAWGQGGWWRKGVVLGCAWWDQGRVGGTRWVGWSLGLAGQMGRECTRKGFHRTSRSAVGVW